MQRNDCVSEFLSVDGGDYNDVLLAYYQDNGATSNTLQDAEYEFLRGQGAPAASIPDMWYSYLTALGYVGSLSGMLTDFWCSVNPAIETRGFIVHEGEWVCHNGVYLIHT